MTGRTGHGLTGGRSKPHLLALEPRMMFDAAMAATTEAVADRSADSRDAAADHDTAKPHYAEPRDTEARDASIPERGEMVEAAPAEAGATASREIVFIDTSVADYQQLADAWKGRGEVVLIDSRADGIDQVRAALAGRSDISAIHIVSHGKEGVLFLGTTRIDAIAIDNELAGSLAAIGRSLTADGDILLYGCDFAEGTEGARALERFAAATGADVAASTDPTGAAARGGDWDLEAHRGLIEAAGLDGGDWDHLLAPVLIAVQPDSLTVRDADGNVVASGNTGYSNVNNQPRAPGVGLGGTAIWANAASVDGRAVDLKATIVSLTSGDTIRFLHPTSGNGDDANFLIVAGTNTGTSEVKVVWQLIDQTTGQPLPADVRFTIADIDGTGATGGTNGNPFTRETLVVGTENLSYYTRENVSDIYFEPTLSTIIASGKQNETADPPTSISAASFDWTKVSEFAITYQLNRAGSTQAQFFHDGDADFRYTTPVYVSIPRLDLDADNSTATGADAHFTFNEGDAAIGIVDTDLSVGNPMGDVTGATVTLTNAKPDDTFIIGTLPSGITATIGTGNAGAITVTLTGNGTAQQYTDAIKAITYRNTSEKPDTTQRVINITFKNTELTSNVGTSRIDVVSVNDAPTANPDRVTTNEDTAVTVAVTGNDTDPDGDTLTVTAATVPSGNGTVTFSGGSIRYTPKANFNGTDIVNYTVSDGQGGTASSTLTVTVTAVNDAPTRVGTLPAQSAADADTVSIPTRNAFTDVDGDTLSYSATGLPAGLTIGSDGVISGTLGRSASQANGGVYDIVVTARDPSGASTTQPFRLTVGNPAPTAPNFTRTTDEDTAFTIDVLQGASDPDGDPLTVENAAASHGTVVRNNDGTLTYTPDADYNGTDTITYTVSDGEGGRTPAKVDVTINPVDDAPRPVGPAPRYTAVDASPVDQSVTGAFNDPEGDALTYTAAGLPAFLTLSTDGRLTGTPGRSASQVNGGVYSFDVTATDPAGRSVTRTVTLTVTNPAPVTAAHSATTAEETPVQLTVLDTDSDPDGDTPLTVSNAAAGHGTATVNPDGTIAYTPDRDFFGTDTVTYTLTDADGASTPGSVTVTVTNVQDAPVAADDTLAATEDTPVTFDPRANDRDADNDPLTIVAATADRGTVTIDPDGRLTYRPPADGNGSDTIRYTISDGQGGTADATVAVTIAAVDDAPVAVGTPPALTGRDGEQATYATAPYFAEVDRETLHYSATGLPAGFAIDAATGEIAGTPGRSASQLNNGRYTIDVVARDPGGKSATQRFELTITNPAPTAVDDAARTPEDTAITLDPRGNDRDPDGDPLTITSATADNGRVTIDPDGRITYTPNANFNGVDTIRYAIADGEGGTAAAIVRVTVDPVNDAPVARPIPVRYTTADGQMVSAPAALAFGDPDRDALRYTATGLPAGLSIDPATGVISGTVERSASQVGGGRYAVRIVATDPDGLSATQDVVLDVTNPAPVATDDTATVVEDTPTLLRPLDNDRDPDGDPLTIVAAAVAHGAVAINSDGTLLYTPDADFHGDDVVRYTISDGQGGTADAVVRVTVTPVNDAPDAAPLPARSDPSATDVSVPVAGAFADRDGDPLTFSATGLPPGLSIDPATGVVSGTITPGTAYGGPTGDGRYTVVVTATDPAGATGSSGFTWTIDPVAPVARDDAYTTPEDTAVTLTVLANDSDGDADPLTIVAATATNGSVAIVGDQLVFTPARDFNGTAVVTYTIADPAGNRATATATVTVTPVNDAPVATAIATAPTARDGQAVTLDLGSYFADVDGDPLVLTATGLPPGLTLDPVTGRIGGTLASDASRGGTYRVVVTATDPSGAAASSAFAWTIVNPAPTATDDRATTDEDRAVTIPVLGNDFDPDGDAIAPVAASAAHGTVAINSDGTLTYTPDAEFNGDDVVTYTITDGDGGRATGSVLVTVLPVADAPVAVGPAPAPSVVVERQVVAIDAAPLFADGDGDTLRYTATGLPPGLTIDPATGAITGQIAVGARAVDGGVYRAVVTATDPAGASASTIVEFQVVNRAPATVGDPAAPRSTPEGTSVSVDTAPSFADADGDALRYAATDLPAGLTIDPITGRITGTIAAGARDVNGGVYRTVVTATDAAGATASMIVEFQVPNRAPATVGDPAAPRSTPEGTPVSVDTAPSFADADGDALRYAATDLPAGLTIDPVTGRIAGTIAAGARDVNGGVYRTVVTAADRFGATASTVVEFRVPNRAPTLIGDAATLSRTAPEGRPAVIDAATLFGDADGDRLTYAATGLPAGLSIDPFTGAITGSPARGQGAAQAGGRYPVTVTASDGRGGSVSATVTITVVNQPPVAADDAASVGEDGSVTIPVLANDRDPNGDPLTVVAASAGNGSVTINADGTIAYRPGTNFAGTDTIRYTISDGQGGTADAVVRVTVAPINDAPAIPTGDRPIDAVGGRPVVIDGLAGVTDAEGDRLTITGATAAQGTVAVGPDGRLVYAPPLGFVGIATITYTVSDGQGGIATATILVRVADGRGADIEQLLQIGRVSFPNPPRALVSVPVDGIVANPLSIAAAVDAVRSLRGTALGDRPVIDAVESVRDLRSTRIDDDAIIAGEVARLDRLTDFRDAGDRLFDQRWGDFLVRGLTGFSAAADGHACVMVESVVRGGAVYLEVRDTATDGRPAIRSVDVTPARGDRHPGWLRVDHRGLAIIERGADMDELHLLVRVTRENGRTTTTRIVVQGQTGEVELDRPPGKPHAPLHAHLQTPAETRAAAAARLAASFE